MDSWEFVEILMFFMFNILNALPVGERSVYSLLGAEL